MKEQILDISFVLNAINGKVDSLTKQLNIVLEENIVLKKEIVVLKDRLAVYETPKDSHNSSIPPSKESIKSNAAKSQKLLANSHQAIKSSTAMLPTGRSWRQSISP